MSKMPLPENVTISEVKISHSQCEQWIADLRSGQYEQGRSKLMGKLSDGEKSVTKYCCLGVFADKTRLLIGDLARERISPRGLEDEDEEKEYLLGFCTSENMPLAYTEHLLAEANDSGVDFSEIADWLAKYVLPACPEEQKWRPV